MCIHSVQAKRVAWNVWDQFQLLGERRQETGTGEGQALSWVHTKDELQENCPQREGHFSSAEELQKERDGSWSDGGKGGQEEKDFEKEHEADLR